MCTKNLTRGTTRCNDNNGCWRDSCWRGPGAPGRPWALKRRVHGLTLVPWHGPLAGSFGCSILSHFAGILQFRPHCDSFLIVHVEQFHGRPPRCADTLDACTFHGEVLVPGVFSRVEERYDAQRLRVDCAEIRSLVTIAVRARQSQIRRFVAASVLPCPDVFDVEGQRRSRCLWEPTVFAAIAGAVPDKLTQGRIHLTTLPDFAGLRAPEPVGS